MKFCKDCKNYHAAVSGDGGTLLPGFFLHIPAQCDQDAYHMDLVTGEKRRKTVDCTVCRQEEALCGREGKRFDPVTLDGRLAMLEESK